MAHYIGIHFKVSTHSYCNATELQYENIIIFVETTHHKSIILSSYSNSKNLLEMSHCYVYTKELELKNIHSQEINALSPIFLKLKISNSNSFSLTDVIPYTIPQTYVEFQKETDIKDSMFLDDEIKIRMQHCLLLLSLQEYVK